MCAEGAATCPTPCQKRGQRCSLLDIPTGLAETGATLTKGALGIGLNDL